MSTVFVIQGIDNDGKCFMASYVYASFKRACSKALSLTEEGATVSTEVDRSTGMRIATVGKAFTDYVITEVELA